MRSRGREIDYEAIGNLDADVSFDRTIFFPVASSPIPSWVSSVHAGILSTSRMTIRLPVSSRPAHASSPAEMLQEDIGYMPVKGGASIGSPTFRRG